MPTLLQSDGAGISDAAGGSRLTCFIGKFVFEIGAEALLDRAAAGLQIVIDAVAAIARLIAIRRRIAAKLRHGRFGGAIDHARLALGRALEQGILFELPST